MANSKQKKTTEQIVLCEGVAVSEEIYSRQENRLFTLLIKGAIVYLLSMGSVGFYLSSFKISYNVLLCHVVIGVLALFCAMLYYRLLVENLGYLTLLIMFAGLVYLLRYYINSGFYAVVNITTQTASEYFGVDVRKLYTEMIGNRQVTITCFAMFTGIVLDILLNVYISRRMQYGTAIFIVMLFNLIPLYMTEEPNLLYGTMVLAGIALAYVFKSGRHYSPQISTKRNNRVFTERGHGKNKELFYVYDSKAMLQCGAFVCAFVVLVVSAVSSLRPKETFNVGYKANEYKEKTMEIVGIVLLDGLEGLYHPSYDVGGMNSGKLGSVSSIRLDHQTDLIVKVTPYDFGRIYLRSFVGETYHPYENYWSTNPDRMESTLTPEADALEDAYNAGKPNTARGIMQIRNVGAYQADVFLPYYGKLPIENDGRGNDIITYYPRMEGNNTTVLEGYYGDAGSFCAEDLEIPAENKRAIEELAAELALNGRREEDVVEALLDYYQESIPYTVKPGKTPKREDFVNYFLLDNRKGYCAHYASAATLLFRYMGIPARYVEGYAIDYYQITMGELVEDAEYADYYDGYSYLGETALVEVDVTDADAHAWVEIYSKEYGWHPVEVTPSGGDTEEEEDFWTAFDRFVGGDSGDAEDNDVAAGIDASSFDGFIKGIGTGILAAIGVLIVVLFGRIGIRNLIFFIRFQRSTRNDRLIMIYGKYRKKRARRDKTFAKLINYREQIAYLEEKRAAKNQDVITDSQSDMSGENEEKPSGNAKRMITILERAGFSNREISEEEYRFAEAWVKERGRK